MYFSEYVLRFSEKLKSNSNKNLAYKTCCSTWAHGHRNFSRRCSPAEWKLKSQGDRPVYKSFSLFSGKVFRFYVKSLFIFAVPLQMLPKCRRWMPWMTHWRRWAVGEAHHAMHPFSVYPLIRLRKGTSRGPLGFLQLRGWMSLWKNLLSVRGTQRGLGEKSCFSQIPSVCLINHLKNKIENTARILTSDWQNFTLPTQIFLGNTGMFL